MPTLVVDPTSYAHAADSMATVAKSTQAAVGSLVGELGGSSGMGGSDDAGVEWANSYDDGARAALQAAASAVAAAGNVATRLHATGANHAQADASSTIGGGDGALSAAPTPPTVSESSVPSAAGGSGGGPPGWSLVEGLVGYAWPNGHQDRLHAADAAWKSAAAQLQDAAGPTGLAASTVSAQQSPEAAAAAKACTDTGTHLRDLSTVFTQIGSSCTEYATHLDEAHHEIISTLEELIIETAAIEAAGAAFAIFTAGLDEIAAQAAVAARIATAAAKIRRVIEALIEAARVAAASVGRLAGRATEVLTKLEKLRGTGVVRSAVAAAARPAAVASRSVDGATAAFGFRSGRGRNWRAPPTVRHSAATCSRTVFRRTSPTKPPSTIRMHRCRRTRSSTTFSARRRSRGITHPMTGLPGLLPFRSRYLRERRSTGSAEREESFLGIQVKATLAARWLRERRATTTSTSERGK